MVEGRHAIWQATSDLIEIERPLPHIEADIQVFRGTSNELPQTVRSRKGLLCVMGQDGSVSILGVIRSPSRIIHENANARLYLGETGMVANWPGLV